MKAFIMAAGFGRRMGELCRGVPKPLLPVAGYPLICHTLFRLYLWRTEAAVINVHYLGEQIVEYLGDFPHFPLEFSREQSILGTAGGLRSVLPFFRNEETMILINPDTILLPGKEDDPRKAIGEIDNSAAALLFLKEKRENADVSSWSFRTGGPSGKDQKTGNGVKMGKVAMRDEGPYYYIGYALLRPSFYQRVLCENDFDLGPLWKKQGEAGRLQGRIFEGGVTDAGTATAYRKLSAALPSAESLLNPHEFSAWQRFLQGWRGQK